MKIGIGAPSAAEFISDLREKAESAYCFRLSSEIDHERPNQLVYFRTDDGQKECSDK